MYAMTFDPNMLKEEPQQQEYLVDIDVNPKYKILEADDL